MTLGQAALKWLLAEPLVVTTLPNIYDDEQLRGVRRGERPAGSDAERDGAHRGAERDELRRRRRADELQGNHDARRDAMQARASHHGPRVGHRRYAQSLA